ncbi:hypothetical protein KDA23_04075 [Candidatus Saccharibacteria bacterium]|nr:hypothetical protein [Candidatus Saccharibacteria bacterium]
MSPIAPHRNPDNFPAATDDDLKSWKLSLRFDQQMARVRRAREVVTAKAIAGAGAAAAVVLLVAERPGAAAAAVGAGLVGAMVQCENAVDTQAELRQLQATEQELANQQVIRLNGEIDSPTD